MKRWLLIVLGLLVCGQGVVAQSVEVDLTSGSKIKGTVESVTATEVVIKADFGSLRLPLDQLTQNSRDKLVASQKPQSTEDLLRRIAELEAKVAYLQQENEKLRQAQATQVVPTTVPVNRFSGSATSTATTSRCTISSTGKRHNSNCRYYSVGRPCGSTDGIACKICGG